MAKRELIDTGTVKRFVRRRKAKLVVKSGQGDMGDRKRRGASSG
jgi:hypothetical protein